LSAPAPVHAITGAPGAGKSTLLAELAARGVATQDEVARAMLRQPGGMAMRASDPEAFAEAMFAAEHERWRAAQVLTREAPVVCDRGWPDIVGFLRLEGRTVPEALERACLTLRYAEPVFRAPPWQAIYRPDEQRIQTWAQARASDAAVCAAWRAFDYDLVDLPLANPSKRADFVLRRLAG
jgi:predicted ATPase